MRRSFLVALLAISVLATPLRGSVSLLHASSARVSFGDIAAIAGVSALTVAFTVKPTATPSVGQFIVHQFGSTNASAAFLFDVASGNGLRWLCHNGTGLNYMGVATNVGLTSGTTYRIVGTWAGDTNSMKIWIDGTSRALSVTNGGSGSLTDSSESVILGYNATRPTDDMDGEYSEFAIWTEVVPDWVAAAYGKGMSPRFYKTANSVLYAPLVNTNTDGLRDVWGGLLGTNTSGTSAGHPGMYYPAQ